MVPPHLTKRDTHTNKQYTYKHLTLKIHLNLLVQILIISISTRCLDGVTLIYRALQCTIHHSVRPDVHIIMVVKLDHDHIFSDQNRISIPLVLQGIQHTLKQHILLHFVPSIVPVKHTNKGSLRTK